MTENSTKKRIKIVKKDLNNKIGFLMTESKNLKSLRPTDSAQIKAIEP